MAENNDAKQQRRIKIKKIRERIERLVQRGLIEVDFYASVSAQLDRAEKQLEGGQREDEFNQEDLADQRVDNKVGDEDEETEGDEEAGGEDEEESEPEQTESDQPDEPEQRRPDEYRRRRTPKRTTKPKPTKAPTPAPTPAAAGGGAAAGGRVAVGARGAALLASPTTWIVIAVILVLVLLVGLVFLIFGGAGNKALDAAGGSIPIGLDFQNSEHKKLVADVMRLRQDGKLLVPDDLAKDLDWQPGAGAATHTLDWRTMETLRYLGNKWEVIGIKMLKTNSPDMTRRESAAKEDEGKDPIDAPSAYSFGQGIAIDRIGMTSPGLTEAMGLDAPVPIQVSWQRTLNEKESRGIYEQLQVDGRRLFNTFSQAMTQADTSDKGLEVLARAHDQAVADSTRNPQAKITDVYMQAIESLDNLLINLNRLRGIGNLDNRTMTYSARALANLEKVRANLEKSGTAFIAEWGEQDTITAMRNGLQATFRAMQVANMVGWRGNEKEIALWKAYEARQNIRQLTLDLLRLPVTEVSEGVYEFNGDLAVRQVIVYSPEDDLDNGLPDFDVFPQGAIAVDEGGVGYDPSLADGVLDIRDSHFMALPVDNGVFSKLGTCFVYKVEGAAEWAAELGEFTFGLTSKLHNDIWNGCGVDKLGEDVVAVSYHNFVHVGF